MARKHIGIIMIICTLSDVVPISAGIGGVGLVICSVPLLIEIVKWG